MPEFFLVLAYHEPERHSPDGLWSFCTFLHKEDELRNLPPEQTYAVWKGETKDASPPKFSLYKQFSRGKVPKPKDTEL